MGACLANSTEFNVSLYIFHSQAPDVIIVSGFYFCNKYVPTWKMCRGIYCLEKEQNDVMSLCFYCLIISKIYTHPLQKHFAKNIIGTVYMHSNKYIATLHF